MSSVAFGVGSASDAELPAVELQVKSTYLYNLPKFVRWPEPVLENSDNKLTICVIGHEDMRDYLYKLDDRQLPKNQLKVSYRNLDASLLGCHMVYFGVDKHLDIGSKLEWCHRNHVLTIGDQPGFVESGGIIGFSLIDERVRLVISRSATRASGLQISAKLLELAQVVD